jgi:AbrB family looped-hinge helix DNA binding protein
MKAILSSKGQVVLPAEVRRQLRLHQGDPLAVEVRDGSIVLRPMTKPRRYKTGRHPVSDLPVMIAVEPSGRRATAAEIARLHAELL